MAGSPVCRQFFRSSRLDVNCLGGVINSAHAATSSRSVWWLGASISRYCCAFSFYCGRYLRCGLLRSNGLGNDGGSDGYGCLWPFGGRCCPGYSVARFSDVWPKFYYGSLNSALRKNHHYRPRVGINCSLGLYGLSRPRFTAFLGLFNFAWHWVELWLYRSDRHGYRLLYQPRTSQSASY